jgi:hypothetical protein
MWICIKNDLRTPFCHKYNNSKTCIECKWNQDPEVKDLYDYTNAKNYYLDYALYTKDSKLYCINNKRRDHRIESIDSSFTLSELKDNCA